jgi:hypothetical protein
MARARGRQRQPPREFCELFFAGDLVADDRNIVRSFNAQTCFAPRDTKNLDLNAQMGEQNLFVFLAR